MASIKLVYGSTTETCWSSTSRITTPSLILNDNGILRYTPLFSGNAGQQVENGDYNYTLGHLKVGDLRAVIGCEEADLFLIADNFYTFKNGVLSCTNNPTITKCNIHKVGAYGLYYTFYDCTGLTSVSFPSLTNIGERGLYYTFYNCTGLTGSISFPNLNSVGAYGSHSAFYNCTGLTSVSFPNLNSIGGRGLYYAFYKCTGLTSVSFPNLNSIGERGLFATFYNCTGLTSVSFPNLTSIGNYGLYYAFQECTGLKEVHFKSSLSGNSQCTASNMGCSKATIYFDL